MKRFSRKRPQTALVRELLHEICSTRVLLSDAGEKWRKLSEPVSAGACVKTFSHTNTRPNLAALDKSKIKNTSFVCCDNFMSVHGVR